MNFALALKAILLGMFAAVGFLFVVPQNAIASVATFALQLLFLVGIAILSTKSSGKGKNISKFAWMVVLVTAGTGNAAFATQSGVAFSQSDGVRAIIAGIVSVMAKEYPFLVSFVLGVAFGYLVCEGGYHHIAGKTTNNIASQLKKSMKSLCEAITRATASGGVVGTGKKSSIEYVSIASDGQEGNNGKKMEEIKSEMGRQISSAQKQAESFTRKECSALEERIREGMDVRIDESDGKLDNLKSFVVKGFQMMTLLSGGVSFFFIYIGVKTAKNEGVFFSFAAGFGVIAIWCIAKILKARKL